MARYFPGDFPVALPCPLPHFGDDKTDNAGILFVLSTTCRHCQTLLDRLVQDGSLVQSLYFVYCDDGVVSKSAILETTGLEIATEVLAFPHAIILTQIPRVMPLQELYATVFGTA
jgi:hypothetical protein